MAGLTDWLQLERKTSKPVGFPAIAAQRGRTKASTSRMERFVHFSNCKLHSGCQTRFLFQERANDTLAVNRGQQILRRYWIFWYHPNHLVTADAGIPTTTNINICK